MNIVVSTACFVRNSIKNTKMYGKFLKKVNWIINVPKEDKIENRNINSTNFLIDYDGVISEWRLIHKIVGKRNYVLIKIILS